MRPIDGDKLMMSLADWWYSSFGQEETEEAKAIKTVMGKVEESLGEFTISAMEKQEQDRWIQCKERLPELGVDVLITDEYGDVLQATYTEWLGNESFISAEESIIIEDVIAWRPLPEGFHGE